MPSSIGRPETPISVIISCKTVKKRPVENTVRDPETCLYSIPLGSPTRGLKLPYVHVPGVTATVVLVHRGDGPEAGTGPGWGAGWVYRVGNTGTYPCPARFARGGPQPSEADP